MTIKRSLPRSIQRLQHERFTEDSRWRLWDFTVGPSGNIAVSGYNDGTGETFIDLYSERYSASTDEPKLYYSKEFENYNNFYWRYVSFLHEPDDIICCIGNILQIFDTNREHTLKECVLNDDDREVTSLYVGDGNIFVGLAKSNEVKVYDIKLVHTKSVTLKGISYDGCPWDMVVSFERLFMCFYNDFRVLSFSTTHGEMLLEFQQRFPSVQDNEPLSISVNEEFELFSVLYWDYMRFYSLNTGKCVFEVNTDPDDIRIRFHGSRLFIGNEVTGEVNKFDLEKFLTHAILRKDVPVILQEDYMLSQSQKPLAETEAFITMEGGKVTIPNTKVTLTIDPGALPPNTNECEIKVKIIPRMAFRDQDLTFSSNSSVVVEILPNNLTLRRAAQLTIPHCLLLEEGAKHKAKIFMSHHEKGCEPHWFEDKELTYRVEGTRCIVWLERFCWVTIKIEDKTVLAKKLILYACGKKLIDKYADIAVGYYPDLDEEGKFLQLNKDMVASRKTPFTFMKEGSYPLQLMLEKYPSDQWTLWSPNENSMEIAFNDIAASLEYSCPFTLIKTVNDAESPMCIFRASQEQGQQPVKLPICPEMLDSSDVHVRQGREFAERVIKLDSDTENRVIRFLSKNIGRDWMDVGRCLTVPEGRLESIKADCEGNQQECIYQMLLYWKRIKGAEAQFRTLAVALRRAERHDLADRVMSFADIFG